MTIDVDLSRWKINPDGSFDLSILTAHQAIPLEGNGIGLHLEIKQPASRTDETHSAKTLQFAMSTIQAKRLGALLVALAESLEELSATAPRSRQN